MIRVDSDFVVAHQIVSGFVLGPALLDIVPHTDALRLIGQVIPIQPSQDRSSVPHPLRTDFFPLSQCDGVGPFPERNTQNLRPSVADGAVRRDLRTRVARQSRRSC